MSPILEVIQVEGDTVTNDVLEIDLAGASVSLFTGGPKVVNTLNIIVDAKEDKISYMNLGLETVASTKAIVLLPSPEREEPKVVVDVGNDGVPDYEEKLVDNTFVRVPAIAVVTTTTTTATTTTVTETTTATASPVTTTAETTTSTPTITPTTSPTAGEETRARVPTSISKTSTAKLQEESLTTEAPSEGLPFAMAAAAAVAVVLLLLLVGVWSRRRRPGAETP